jgi:hypothetical protein
MKIYFAGSIGKFTLSQFFTFGVRILSSYYDLVTKERAYGMDKRFEEIITHIKEGK